MNFALYRIVSVLVDIFYFLILIDVIGSWLLVARVNLPDAIFRLLETVRSITGVVLNPLRRILPNLGGLDLSPFVALILLNLLQNVLRRVLLGY